MSININEGLIMHPSMIETGNGNKTNIKIERVRVGLVSKVFAMIWSRLGVWPILCIYTTILAIISLSIVLYMKLMGEISPFCLYDNWYYLAYYCFLAMFSAVMLPLTDFSLFDYESSFWKWTRKIGATVWYLEIQGLAYFMVYFRDIAYDLEYDDEAQLLVWSLSSISVIRFATISIAYWIAIKTLQRVIWKNQLDTNYYGNTLAHFADLFVFQFISTSIYVYSFSLISIGFALSIAFFYISFAKI